MLDYYTKKTKKDDDDCTKFLGIKNKASEEKIKKNIDKCYENIVDRIIKYRNYGNEVLPDDFFEKYGMTPEQFKVTGLKITDLSAKQYPILEELIPIIVENELAETNETKVTEAYATAR